MATSDYLQFSSEYDTLQCYTFRTILGKEENNLNNVNTLWMYQRSTLYTSKSFLHSLEEWMNLAFTPKPNLNSEFPMLTSLVL